MTLEEYITSLLDYYRKNHLALLYKRTEPVIVPFAQRKATEEELNKMKNERLQLDLKINIMSNLITSKVKDMQDGWSLDDLYNSDPEYTETVLHFWLPVAERNIIDDNIKTGYVCTGANCIYNATVDYPHPVYRVSDLKKNPEKFGFKLVELALPGDVVTTKTGSHGTTYAGDGKYNWSAGNVGPDQWILDGYDPNLEGGNIYTFVGTPEDSIKWRKMYEDGIEIPEVKIQRRRLTHKLQNIDYESDQLINLAIDRGFEQKKYKPEYIYTVQLPSYKLSYLNYIK